MTNIQKYCIINYTEYKGVLKLGNVSIIDFFSLMWVYSVPVEIVNYSNNFEKDYKEKVSNMKKIFKKFLAFLFILQGISMVLYVQYNNRL